MTKKYKIIVVSSEQYTFECPGKGLHLLLECLQSSDAVEEIKVYENNQKLTRLDLGYMGSTMEKIK